MYIGEVVDSTLRVRSPFIPFTSKEITINRFDPAYNLVVYFYNADHVCLASTYLMNKKAYYTVYPQMVTVPPPTRFIKIDVGKIDGTAIEPGALTGKEFKIEKGNIATDWTASDIDVKSNITAVLSYLDGAFRDGVISETEAQAIEKYLNEINIYWSSVESQYASIYINDNLLGEAKSNLESAYDNAGMAKTNLITSVNTAIADSKTTVEEKADVDSKFSLYSTTVAILQTRMQEALDSIEKKRVDDAIIAATYWSVRSSSPVIYKDAINAATSGVHTPITVIGELRSGTTTTPGGFITVTANGGTEGLATASPVTISPTNTEGKTSYTVKLYDDVVKTTLLDTMTIPVVFKGAAGINAINIVLNNEADVLPAAADGTGVDYTDSGMTIRVFEGATELDYDGAGTTVGKYNVVASGTNITAGTKAENGLQCVVGDASAMTADKAIITLTITGKTLSGTAFSFTKIQTITKSKAGVKGDKGDDGTSVTIKGSVATSTALPSSGNTIGDGYITDDNGHLWVWTGTAWTDAGQIKGDSGQTPYLHIAYATNATGTEGFSVSNTSGKTYMGTYTDYTVEDSVDPTKYKWMLTKGETGAILYTWIKYATDVNGTGLTDAPDGMTYIGLAYNKTTPVESTTASDYAWSLIKGEKGDTGVAGTKGADGVTTYTWIKYSNNADGTGLYDVPTSATLYIGIAVNKTTSTESTVKTDYTWSKFKGDQGVKGDTGATGRSITMVDVEFAQNTSATVVPTTGWQTTAPVWTDGQYIWTRTKTTYSTGDPTYSDPANITGSKGSTGTIGQGVESVTEQYHISSSKTVQPLESSAGWNAVPPTWSQGMYIWSRVKVVYKNPASTIYMGYSVSSEWEAVNNIQVGGRNLLSGLVYAIYNGFGVPATLTKLSDTFFGQEIQQLSMTPNDASLSSFQTEFYSHGVAIAPNHTFYKNTKYIVSVYWKGVSTTDIQVGLAASNIGGWTDIETISVGNGWFRSSAGRNGDIEDKTDYLYFSFRCPGAVVGTPIVMNWTCPKLEIGNKMTDYTPAPEELEAKVNLSKAVTDKFGTTIDGALVEAVVMLLRELNSETETAGISGIQGDGTLPAFFSGGTYAEAIAGIAKTILKHDGSGQLAGGSLWWDVLGRLFFGKSDNGESIKISTEAIPDQTEIDKREVYTLPILSEQVIKDLNNPEQAGIDVNSSFSQEFTLDHDGLLTVNSSVIYQAGLDIVGFGCDGFIYIEKYNGSTWDVLYQGEMDSLSVYLTIYQQSVTKGRYRLRSEVTYGYTSVEGPNATIVLDKYSEIKYQLNVKKLVIGLDGIALYDSMTQKMFRLSLTDVDHILTVIGGFKWSSPDTLKYLEINNYGVKVSGVPDIPGGLGGGLINSAGTLSSGWGKVYNATRVTTTTTIHHNITDTKFMVDVTPRSAFTWYLSSFTAASSPTANDGTIVLVCTSNDATFNFKIVRTL